MEAQRAESTRRAWGRRLLPAVVLALGCAAPPADPFETLERSALYSDTSTVPRGERELRLGALLGPGVSAETSLGLTFGLTGRAELSLETAPYSRAEGPGPDARGPGDVRVGGVLRVRDETPGRVSLAVGAGVGLPTGDETEGLGTGETALFASLVATKHAGGSVWTGAYELGVLGEPDGSGADLEHVFTLSAARTLAERKALFAELRGVHRPEGERFTWGSRVGLALALPGRTVLDVAVEADDSSASSGGRVFLGLSSVF